MDPKLTPILISALVVFALYRRVRRSFGRQPVRRARLMIRAGLVVVVAAVVAFFAPLPVEEALGAGILVGVGLGYFGLRHTRFELGEQGPVYIPHTYIGLFVTSLLVIRLLMRYFTFQQMPGAAAGGNPWVFYQHNPLTVAIMGLVVGYYGFYNIGLLKRSRALEAASAAGAGTTPAPASDGAAGTN